MASERIAPIARPNGAPNCVPNCAAVTCTSCSWTSVKCGSTCMHGPGPRHRPSSQLGRASSRRTVGVYASTPPLGR